MRILTPLTVTAATYAAGRSVGGKISLGRISRTQRNIAITDVVLLDKKANAVAYDLALFDSDLAGTVPDNVAYAIAAADLPKCQGWIPLVGMSNLGANGGVMTVSPIYKRMTLVDLAAFAVLVARGAPTFTSTSDLTLVLITEEVEGR